MEKTNFNATDNQEPFFGYTLSIISGKWKLQIIYHLSKNGAVRYNELQRMLGKITFKTLSTALKEMVNDGIIHRKEYPQIPPRSNIALLRKDKLYGLSFRKCVNGENIISHKNNCKSTPITSLNKRKTKVKTREKIILVPG